MEICGLKRCKYYDGDRQDNCSSKVQKPGDCPSYAPLTTEKDAVVDVQPAMTGLSDITPLEISALAQRIISNTTALTKISFNKKLAIQNIASHYAIEQIEKFLKENGR